MQERNGCGGTPRIIFAFGLQNGLCHFLREQGNAVKQDIIQRTAA